MSIFSTSLPFQFPSALSTQHNVQLSPIYSTHLSLLHNTTRIFCPTPTPVPPQRPQNLHNVPIHTHSLDSHHLYPFAQCLFPKGISKVRRNNEKKSLHYNNSKQVNKASYLNQQKSSKKSH